jgi:hypothetical protein
MQTNAERHAHWQKTIEDQIQSRLSRREYCERHQIVLSQFGYYYAALKKRQRKNLPETADVVPVHIRPAATMTAQDGVKVLLSNGIQVLLPCRESHQLKPWLEVLRSC